MKVSQIKIKNYRLLKDFTIDLEDNLSLIIGKNNCGKTSFLSLLERFLFKAESESYFSFEDFNLDYQQEIKDYVEKTKVVTEKEQKMFRLGITLDLHIEYNDTDDLSNISLLMMSLDPTKNTVILRFEYAMNYDHLKPAIKAYGEYEEEGGEDAIDFMKINHNDYFKKYIWAVDIEDETIQTPFEKNKVSDIINFQRIHAKRAVNNEPGSNRKNDKALSNASSKYYDKVSNFTKEEIERDEEVKELQKKIKKLNHTLKNADSELNGVYNKLFETILGKVKDFGGAKTDESLITIKSTLEGRNILRENTSVMYEHEGVKLPEDYNGLGYMNLINMIFEIELLFIGFKKAKPADINMIFIEEPEAHTHPQMQHIFIENIKSLLEKNKDGLRNAQTIISTHSPHIVSKSDFEDIKYFRKEGKSIVSKNLKALKPKNENSKNETIEEQNFRFLKQYLTLNKAELFFADKAIFIEGDTEHILLPAIMRKIDSNNYPPLFPLNTYNIIKDIREKKIIKQVRFFQYDKKCLHIIDRVHTPLLSQHISIVEVGAYTHIFEKFIDFLGIKVLIITDLDAVNKQKTKKTKKNGEQIEKDMACRVANGEKSSNSSINHFLKDKFINFTELKNLSLENKTVLGGKIQLAFQTEESDFQNKLYHARSFEDAFIHLNRNFITESKNRFKGLQNYDDFDDTEKDAYDLAEDCIKSKSAFALDILYFGGENFEKWQIPSYIKQGLLWLRQ